MILGNQVQGAITSTPASRLRSLGVRVLKHPIRGVRGRRSRRR